MRPSYALLLAIATTFLASDNTVTAPGRSTGVSTMASPELTGIGQVIGGNKRSLRYHDDDNRADEEEEENVDEEERAGGANLFDTTKLNEMVKGTKRIARFERWVKYKYNPHNLPSVMDNYSGLRDKFRIWYYYTRIQ
ncbi:Putative RxLR effector [Phytophthora palmivora]|uniref:RxLR effector protein n=1 Tax=Phytophthora palmivora TaxID=4796 RepID=A0A2P4YNR6_9STRA|nr:Putative RxLR effector [Phytophthora palmivora]